MKYKFIGKEAIEISMLGVIEPGQEFDVNNDAYMHLFKDNPVFEIVKQVVKKEDKVVKKGKDGE